MPFIIDCGAIKKDAIFEYICHNSQRIPSFFFSIMIFQLHGIDAKCDMTQESTP